MGVVLNGVFGKRGRMEFLRKRPRIMHQGPHRQGPHLLLFVLFKVK